jgi:hypothetical protein
MVQSKATTPEAYLAELPDDRRELVSTLRNVILKRLPKGYVEEMGFGMLTYVIPLEKYPDTYNGKPLMYVALGNQKNYVSLYLMAIYGDEDVRAKFESDFKATGKKLNVGGSCVRFKSLDDVPLKVIESVIGAVKPAEYMKRAEALGRGKKTSR